MLSNEAKAIEGLFSIQDKSGMKVPFRLNKAQRFLDENDNSFERVRLLIAKCRQKGFSSGIIGKFDVRCLGKEGTHAVCISHEANATQRLLDRAHYFLRHMSTPPPTFGRNSRTELYFPKTESSYYIGTAGAKAFGRGDTITDLHCSEYAFWDDPVRHMTGLFQAVPQNGRIYIESTGNGRNNDFYYMWENAEAMGYKRVFYPWFADEEYSLDLPPTMTSWKPDMPRYNDYMLSIKSKFKLSDKQMYWYESKLRELREDIRSMQQEYPSEPEECFQATGGSIFPNVKLSISPDWVSYSHNGYYVNKLKAHPHKDFHYVIGADPSGGTGGDDAAIFVFCCETFEQVFELYNKNISPFAFAQLLCEFGKLYNDAFITTEANNHGAAVVPYLKDNYIKSKLFKSHLGTKTTLPKYGWNNTETSKHALIGLMQEMLDAVLFYGVQTVKELKSFEEDADGKMGSKSDNLVIAAGLAMMGLKRYESLHTKFITPSIPKKKEVPNYRTYSLDWILKDLDSRRACGLNVGRGYPN